MGKGHSKVLPPAVTISSLVPSNPAARKSTEEQAKLVAQITQRLMETGINPAAVVVNDTSTAILLPAGASAPIALPLNFEATADRNQDALRIEPHDAGTLVDTLHYAASPETVKTLKHANNLAAPSLSASAAAPAASSYSTGTTSANNKLSGIAEPTYELFVSHCKRTESSEDRAIWVSDIAEGEGLSVFFDRSDLTQITKEKLRESIEASRVVVTILDPYTFDSEWVCLENEWARDAGIPVVGMYDGDKFRWEQIAKWKEDHPHVFSRPVINYQKDYRVESKKRLLAAVRDAAKEASAAAAKKTKSKKKAAAAAVASPGAKKSPASLVRIAVGKSTLTDASHAVDKAWRHLVSKLGGLTPHMCIVAYTGRHDAAAIATALARTVSAGTAVVGMSAGLGIMFEDTWLSSADGSPGLSMWGIFDPQGAYEVVYDASGLRQTVKAKVGDGIDKQVTRGPPRFTLAYTSPSFEASSLGGIHDVIGESALVFGIGVSGPLGFTMDPENVPRVFALRGGEPFDASLSLGCGLASVFCWPSVFIAGAFSPGGSCCAKPQVGTITKMTTAPAISLMMNPPAAFAGASSEREAPLDTVIVEIDGRPALSVYREWLSDEERVLLDDIMGGSDTIDPSRMMDWLIFMGSHPFGVPMGKDESGRVVYKQVVAANVSNGTLQLFGGLTVEVGDKVELLSAEDQKGCRERTAETAHRVIADAGFDFDSVQGALTVGCGIFYMLGGMDEGLKDLSERMAAAVNWAPTMGVLGGPELGPMGESKAAHAVYTVGVVVFSSKPAKAQVQLLTDGGEGQRRSSSSMFAG